MKSDLFGKILLVLVVVTLLLGLVFLFYSSDNNSGSRSKSKGTEKSSYFEENLDLKLVSLPVLEACEGEEFLRQPEREAFAAAPPGLAEDQSSNSEELPYRKKADYDKLVLVSTWAPSYCQKNTSGCEIPEEAQKNETWTIHGLWPFKSNVKPVDGPTNCTGCYDISNMSSVRVKLNEKWPNYKKGGTNDDLWKHQYEKHGTCAADVPQFDSQLKYFLGTMDLHDKYDIKDILANGDPPVRPSDNLTYQLADIISALKKGLGVEPAVYCVERKAEQYLLEVRMCFDKSQKPITCGPELVGGGRCNPNKKVIYKTFDASGRRKTYNHPKSRFLLNVAYA